MPCPGGPELDAVAEFIFGDREAIFQVLPRFPVHGVRMGCGQFPEGFKELLERMFARHSQGGLIRRWTVCQNDLPKNAGVKIFHREKGTQN